MGLVHVDAHTDTGDRALGEKIYHGTPFRRCVEEGLLDCGRVVQIGIRGSSYDPDPYQYCRDQVSSATGSRRAPLSLPAINIPMSLISAGKEMSFPYLVPRQRFGSQDKRSQCSEPLAERRIRKRG